MDSARWGKMRWGYFRWGHWTSGFSYETSFERLMKNYSASSYDVTRKILRLENRDSLTGWSNKVFTEKNIEMRIIPSSETKVLAEYGVFITEDALGVSDDPVTVGDHVVDNRGRVFEVRTVQVSYEGDSVTGSIISQLRRLPFEE